MPTAQMVFMGNGTHCLVIDGTRSRWTGYNWPSYHPAGFCGLTAYFGRAEKVVPVEQLGFYEHGWPTNRELILVEFTLAQVEIGRDDNWELAGIPLHPALFTKD